jgi:hypothetical protein
MIDNLINLYSFVKPALLYYNICLESDVGDSNLLGWQLQVARLGVAG